KPAAGGRMLARHDGLVVLVEGAVPGERISARVERTGKGMAYASTIDVISPSADRRVPAVDVRCGGQVFAHVAYARQLRLKGEIIQAGSARIGRIPVDVPVVAGSRGRGYRRRAHLHAHGGRVGSFSKARTGSATPP